MNSVSKRFNARMACSLIFFCLISGFFVSGVHAEDSSPSEIAAPAPLIGKGHPVDWWFVFKFNAKSFPGCGGDIQRTCAFGGQPQQYKPGFGQQFVFASSENPSLSKGDTCVGEAVTDPLGATFDQVYNSDDYFYLIWNDQFYDDPEIAGCTQECGSPWGHSKGMLVWDKTGQGFVLQVSTPSWPASGNHNFPRQNDGNTLGCVTDDNVEVSQHFFSLKLNQNDLIQVLNALQNASVVTDPQKPQIVKNGGPENVQRLVNQLGLRSNNTGIIRSKLSTGVELVSKPSKLNVPPWQLVSATLNGLPLKTATWWANPYIPATDASSTISCWQDGLGAPGAVQIATTGQWDNQIFGLTGGSGPDHNHAKIGISTDPNQTYAIFGDMNQQGVLSSDAKHKCSSSQNGRGGLFYIVNDKTLFDGVTGLLKGDTAPVGNGLQ